MQVIGVVDLKAGRAVHALAGRRDSYEPVRAVAGSEIQPGDALAVARAYVDRLGVTELYAADLDAICRNTSQDTVVAALASLGTPLWLDAGIRSVDQAKHALNIGAAHLVVGLETLPSYAVLAEICDAIGKERVAFSLDLHKGEPCAQPDVGSGFSRIGPPQGGPHMTACETAQVIAARAADAGAKAVIVIDLARVGTGTGLDFALIARVRAAVPEVTLLAGGGVRGLEDLSRLADAGCDGALVATALHDGRLGAAEVAAAHELNVAREERY